MKNIFLISALAATLLMTGCFHKKKVPETPPPASAETAAPQPKPEIILGNGEETAPPETDSETNDNGSVNAAPQVIALDAGNLYFRPNNIALKVNRPVTVNYTNKGVHTFTVKELGVEIPLKSASGTFVFTPKKIGTFPLTCEVSGHAQAGMVGTVTVEK